LVDYLDADSDNDGILDGDENGDFDGDGINDRIQVSSDESSDVPAKVKEEKQGGGSIGFLFVFILFGAILVSRRKQFTNIRNISRSLINGGSLI